MHKIVLGTHHTIVKLRLSFEYCKSTAVNIVVVVVVTVGQTFCPAKWSCVANSTLDCKSAAVNGSDANVLCHEGHRFDFSRLRCVDDNATNPFATFNHTGRSDNGTGTDHIYQNNNYIIGDRDNAKIVNLYAKCFPRYAFLTLGAFD